jgi:hypothetical protein
MKKLISLLSLVILTLGSVLALNPVKEYSVTPADYGMDYTEVKITTEDGIVLNAWMFNPKETSYKIIVLSDDGNGNMADLLEQVSNFISLGYYVVTYDYRGYGKSGDFKINNKFYIYSQFEKDLTAVINYLKKEHTSTPKIHLYGVGIGAALSISVGANMDITKIIADSPYSTLEGIKTRIKEVKNEDVLMPLGYDKNLLEPKYALETKGKLISGLLLIAGENDLLYTPKDMKELAKIKSSVTSIYTAKAATSETTFTVDKAKYFDEIKKFCENK